MAARLILQSDWNESLWQNEGQAWVLCKTLGEGSTSIQGELKSQGLDNKGIPQVVASEGFRVLDITRRTITISYPEKDVKAKFQAKSGAFRNIHDRGIVSLDISSGGALGVSSDSNDALRVWQTSDGTVRRELKGHFGEVITCRFFPSGIVVLTGGLDRQIKIWSAEDGSCPVTIRGHSGGVSCTAIVDRGRNIITGSRDGTARLWNCGNSKCLATVHTVKGFINACAVSGVSDSIDLGKPVKPPAEEEVGTAGKLLLLATESGDLIGVGLHSRKKIFQVKGPAAFNCCAFLPNDRVIGGCQDGTVHIVDIRNHSQPAKILRKTSSPILCIQAHKNGFIAGTADGSCFLLDLETDDWLELTGSDCDPIYALCCHGNTLYTACRDGIIRKYQI
ncbi:proteasomal ATPase-associated factor 1-like [Acanthaster planci]|uniref:Proteasomal ATPase-associated factor 1-like n=1 Tax=Acanthaster planci TaxID=133434 RepID=A0A8B7Y9L0_ACAPL|nr:proteasomal ATPase-associated factor 1-like [Acanthaster planci]